MVHQCYPDKCFNIGHGRVCTKCKSGYPFMVPQHKEELYSTGVRLLYRRQEHGSAHDIIRDGIGAGTKQHHASALGRALGIQSGTNNRELFQMDLSCQWLRTHA